MQSLILILRRLVLFRRYETACISSFRISGSMVDRQLMVNRTERNHSDCDHIISVAMVDIDRHESYFMCALASQRTSRVLHITILTTCARRRFVNDFPWELNNVDYMRRILAQITLMLRPM